MFFSVINSKFLYKKVNPKDILDISSLWVLVKLTEVFFCVFANIHFLIYRDDQLA